MVAREELLQIATDHQANEVGVGQLGLREFPGVAAVAQHDGAVGTAADLGEPVRNVNDRHALGF